MLDYLNRPLKKRVLKNHVVQNLLSFSILLITLPLQNDYWLKKYAAFLQQLKKNHPIKSSESLKKIIKKCGYKSAKGTLLSRQLRLKNILQQFLEKENKSITGNEKIIFILKKMTSMFCINKFTSFIIACKIFLK